MRINETIEMLVDAMFKLTKIVTRLIARIEKIENLLAENGVR